MTLTGLLCQCGHDRKYHRKQIDNRKQISYSCVHAVGFQFCKCKNYKPISAIAQQGDEMSKKNGTPKVKKQKSEGRKPTLAPFVDHPFPIYANYKNKEYTATVLSSGVIMFEEKPHATPSAAGRAVIGNYKGKPLQVDGWAFWRFNKDGERVKLDVLRGSKSPLKEVAAKEVKAKAPRKPRTRKAKKASDSPVIETAAQASA